MSISRFARLLFAVVATTTACTQSAEDASRSKPDGAGQAPGDDAGGSPQTPTGPVPFTLSNGVSLAELDLSKAREELSLRGDCEIDADTAEVSCRHITIGSYTGKIVTLPDLSRVALFAAKSLRMETRRRF